MATQYRYLLADLLTNQILAELPLTGVNFTQQLNSAGTFTGKLLLSGVNSAALNVLNGTIPGRCAIYVDRNGTLVWGGIIWSRDYKSSDQHLTISAREFESYFERRRITSTQTFTNTDQLSIVQQLVTAAQAVPFGNIGIAVGTETSGVLVGSQTYYSYELKTYFTAIQDLSKNYNGFDFNITVAYDGDGNPTKTLHLGYPRLGNAYSATSTTVPVFELPGNIVEYTYTEDGSKAANAMYLTGAGSNEGKLIASATDSTKTAAGWALLEESVNYSNITDATLLSGLATGQVNAVSYPPQTIQVVLPPYIDPVYGTYNIGDQARLIILDNRFPSGLDTNYRIIGLNVAPGETGPERVTVTLTYTTN